MDIIKYLGIPAVAFLGFIVFCLAKGGNNKDNGGNNNSASTTTSAPASTPTGGSNESKG